MKTLSHIQLSPLPSFLHVFGKRREGGILFFLLLLFALPSSAQMHKMSPLLRQMAMDDDVRQRRLAGSATAKGIGSQQPRRVCLLMQTTTGDARSVAESYGATIHGQWDDVSCVTMPVSRLRHAAADRRVLRLEAGRSCMKTTTVARPRVGVDKVWQGLSLPQGFTGKGVVIGVEDIGFDLSHPTFFSADMSHYRIKRFWDQLAAPSPQSGSQVAGAPLPVGRDFTTEAEILEYRYARDSRTETHGTWTASIAAGSGGKGMALEEMPKTEAGRFTGVAPEADICLVANAVTDDMEYISSDSLDLYTSATDILGFQYIFDYATSVGKPCVISFSEGSYDDFYGDAMLYSKVLESMVGPGRIIVASAGNQSTNITYARKPASLPVGCVSLISSSSSALYTLKSKGEMTATLTFGHETAAPVTTTIMPKDILLTADTLLTDTFTVADRHYAVAATVYESCYEATDTIMEVFISDLDGSRVGFGQSVDMALSAGTEEAEMFGTGGVFGATIDGGATLLERSHNIHFPAAAPSVVCVGATNSTDHFYNTNGATVNWGFGPVGQRSAYSSVGPTLTGLIKPDVVAPGTYVTGGVNSMCILDNLSRLAASFVHDGTRYGWIYDCGTSASTPVVAGIIALWLQARPDLTPEEVFETLRLTSHPIHSGTPEGIITEKNIYTGWGEIDAYAGLLHLLHLDGIREISRHQPSGAIVCPDSEGNVCVSFGSPTTSDVTVNVYSTAGALVASHSVPAGSTRYTFALPHGMYVVQRLSR